MSRSCFRLRGLRCIRLRDPRRGTVAYRSFLLAGSRVWDGIPLHRSCLREFGVFAISPEVRHQTHTCSFDWAHSLMQDPAPRVGGCDTDSMASRMVEVLHIFSKCIGGGEFGLTASLLRDSKASLFLLGARSVLHPCPAAKPQ